MALSAPDTPRTNFATPRRLGNLRTPGLTDVTSQKTPRKQFSTPRSNYTTPRSNYATPRTKKLESSSNTPECFSNVTVETPVSAANSRNSKEKFDEYDHVFWSGDESSPIYSTQEDVFMTIGKPLLNSAFRGYNACLFAYGQTGSGKSFSMMGKSTCEVIDIDSEQFSGITPRFCRDLFEQISNLDANATVEVSYFEIYNEKIHDLLASNINTNKMPLKVREHPVWGPYVVDLSVHVVKSYSELRSWLMLGNKNRATAATSMNENSSRSHSIFSIELSLSDDNIRTK
ncbi:hypothetical protein NQ317_005874 [Molorchus minor]|uniref:Kinesin motor domain-containing protein n=1 Tax=Molorchus minor TaxID=1323400 RepID=A0ABQ9K0L3_9CUCU|nr:hypothetical protein NQ317_005874 [Molorchus minor]